MFVIFDAEDPTRARKDKGICHIEERMVRMADLVDH
jgi:hypothetical protein